jgi:hypothetical protein
MHDFSPSDHEASRRGTFLTQQASSPPSFPFSTAPDRKMEKTLAFNRSTGPCRTHHLITNGFCAIVAALESVLTLAPFSCNTVCGVIGAVGPQVGRQLSEAAGQWRPGDE